MIKRKGEINMDLLCIYISLLAILLNVSTFFIPSKPKEPTVKSTEPIISYYYSLGANAKKIGLSREQNPYLENKHDFNYEYSIKKYRCNEWYDGYDGVK